MSLCYPPMEEFDDEVDQRFKVVRFVPARVRENLNADLLGSDKTTMEVFREYKIDEHYHISTTSFYRYADHLRKRVEELTTLDSVRGFAESEKRKRVIAAIEYRVLRKLADEKITPTGLWRVVNAYRVCMEYQHQEEALRLKCDEQDLRRKNEEPDERFKYARPNAVPERIPVEKIRPFVNHRSARAGGAAKDGDHDGTWRIQPPETEEWPTLPEEEAATAAPSSDPERGELEESAEQNYISDDHCSERTPNVGSAVRAVIPPNAATPDKPTSNSEEDNPRVVQPQICGTESEPGSEHIRPQTSQLEAECPDSSNKDAAPTPEGPAPPSESDGSKSEAGEPDIRESLDSVAESF